MTLRWRLSLGILALVAVTTMLSFVVGRNTLRPYQQRVFDALVTQAVWVADRVERGDDPDALGAELGLDVRLVDRPLGLPMKRPLRRLDPQRLPEDGLTVLHRGDRVLAFPEGARNRIFVRTDRGWLLVQRDLDPDQPGRRLALVLPTLAVLVFLAGFFLVSSATRPLAVVDAGMARIARGDLSHRLDEHGPGEVATVARSFNQMADRVDAALRTERELMAGLSHELRTPLTRLKLELELLRDLEVAPRRLDAMEGDLDELDGLVGALLELSRMQLGDRRLERVPVDLLEVARDAVATAALTSHPVHVSGRGGTVHGDRALLLRLVLNLVQNAGRYTPAGGRVWVTVDAPTVVVEDEGPGVPDADLPRLFDPFWRGEHSRARATGGVGLGLMLVRQVALLHGGTVAAENRPEGGLRVTVTLG